MNSCFCELQRLILMYLDDVVIYDDKITENKYVTLILLDARSVSYNRASQTKNL